MTIKSIFKELRDRTQSGGGRGRSHIAPDGQGSLLVDPNHHSQWANLPPELLMDVIQRLETTQTTWPARGDVVVCASVCKSWRDITTQMVKTPEESGNITFPISLRQPGPRQSPIHCFIKRDRRNATFQVYLGLSPASLAENGKLLLSAKRVRKTTCTEFVISLGAVEFSRGSHTHTYMGKLRSNFLGTKFTIYDRQAAYDVAVQSSSQPCQRLQSKQVVPRVSAGSYNIGTISYELNMLRARGPRKMQCTMHTIPISAIQEGGTAPTPTAFPQSFEEQLSLPSVPKLKQPHVDLSSRALLEPLLPPDQAGNEPLTLKNKSPRWHEQLQCWCLNFRGRVTVASVKNFQLVASVEPSHHVAQAVEERVILQFGKIGKDIFTMDYCYPLSAFQAFAICLSSFDTKPACE